MPGIPRIIYRTTEQSPIGQIADVAAVPASTGVPSHRVLGSYALILVVKGQGTFADATHLPVAIAPGTAFLLFPDVTHKYGPPRGKFWEEIYAQFRGPVFDLWRSTGILDPDRPVFRLSNVAQWVQRLQSLPDVSTASEVARQIVMVSRFQALLAEIVASEPLPLVSEEQGWITEACNWLNGELAEAMDYHWLAQSVGMSFDGFRKRFAKEMGQTPFQYRTSQRLRAAQQMLAETDMSLKEIAAAVGFYDEFAFSNRFKGAFGYSPKMYRQQMKGSE